MHIIKRYIVGTVSVLHFCSCEIMTVNDVVSAAIGQIGFYQLTRFIAILLVSVPGLCHIFLVVFSTIKTGFWCEDESIDNQIKGECAENCSSYSFDESFWRKTIISEYQLVCSRAPLLCKPLPFTEILCHHIFVLT